MSFLLTGLNHRSAPVEVRERFAVSETRLPETVQNLARHPGIEEALIISTCNRVEFVARAAPGGADLRDFLTRHFSLSRDQFENHWYEHREKNAVRHIFRVACSLDSMIVGEPQILGQVKEAYAVARALGTVNSTLDSLFTRAFAVAKRVRTETAVGASAVSVASVAIDLAKKVFGSLKGRVVYLVGAGKMCELAAQRLLAQGAGSVFVANRTYENAARLAQKFHGEAMLFEQLYETVDRADIVISSTGAPHFIFRREHGEKFLQRRKNRPMFFIDIAVPRDIDPQMNELDGIFVYDIDDLQSVVAANTADRAGEAQRAEALIEAEVERFWARLQTAEVAPTIVSLQEHLETVRQAELDRVRGRLGNLTPEQEMAVEALSHGIINKIMHTPILTLKSAARAGRKEVATPMIELVRRLFNLQEEAAAEEDPLNGKSQAKHAG